MNLHLYGPLFTLLFAFAVPSYGESAYERELKQLIADRDKARAAADVPITARFKASAEQLLKRATQAGDLDAANKIKEAIGPDSSSTGAGRDFIKNTLWGWYVGPNTQRVATIKLLDNGKVETGLNFIVGWEPVGSTEFKLLHRSGGFYMFRYSAATKEAHTTKFAGSLQENKIMRPEGP
jgi:hypothetical protein